MKPWPESSLQGSYPYKMWEYEVDVSYTYFLVVYLSVMQNLQSNKSNTASNIFIS